jgi:hypothetical protein
MVRVVLLDHIGLAFSEVDVPVKPSPQAVVWGEDVFVQVDPGPDGRARYRMIRNTYVVPDTMESGTKTRL